MAMTLTTDVSVDDRVAVHDLISTGEIRDIPQFAAPHGLALLLLAAAALLSTDPDGGEPVEDTDDGVVQNLAVARAF
jgi:hypothetical protein